MKKENWKPINGYLGYYEISDLGRVKSLAKKWIAGKGVVMYKSETFLVFSKVKARNGVYYHITLCVDKVKKSLRINRLVAEHFCFKPKGCNVVNHLDLDTTNNRADNLEWTTTLKNVRYSWEHGNKKALQGENHGCSKLREQDVKEIRRLSATGMLHKEICSRFNVSRTNVTLIVNNKRWKHI
jgi:hypothetical protein